MLSKYFISIAIISNLLKQNKVAVSRTQSNAIFEKHVVHFPTTDNADSGAGSCRFDLFQSITN